ncbi:hypothetical protein GCM10009787_26030 [Streptomyces bangladeshensis]|uniref:5-dehydro-4-deoxyglucarate dehydratase n=1 Tax=Streptomyces bangladeshensis TaxID=295352 RepID=A0ABN3BG96_9ACTN
MGGDPAPRNVARRLRQGMARGVLSLPLTAFPRSRPAPPRANTLARGTPIATVGVPACSSAVHAFAPGNAGAFFAALRDAGHGTADTLLRAFYVPFVELRDRVPGYAVSLVKAAARLRGQRVGPVRAPLTDPAPAGLADPNALLTAGLDLVGASL